MAVLTRNKKYLSKKAYEKAIKELAAIAYEQWIDGED